MVAAFVKGLNDNSNKVAGTTLVGAWSNAAAAGNLIVAAMVFDNAAVASKPIVSSLSKPGGETANWVFLGASRSTSTSTGAFASGELWCIKTTMSWPSGFSMTVTFDTSITMRAASFYEFTGADATPRSTGGTAYSTTITQASASSTGTAPVIGDLVLGLIFTSNSVSVPVGDPDTLGGVWVSVGAGVGSTGSSAATNNMGVLQYKVPTVASHQSLSNLASLTAGNGVVVAVLQAAAAPTTTGRPKVYTGAAWAQKPLKVWTGAAWVEKPIKVWTGSSWKTLT